MAESNRPYLTEDNRDTLLSRATHKTKHQIEELIAEHHPKPDVAPRMRKLPAPRVKTETRKRVELCPERVEPTLASVKERPVAVQPLAPSRYRVVFTASAELHDKLERLRALMRSSVPDGDIAAIIEEAVTEKLERLEAKRYAKTKTPRKSLDPTDTTPSTRHIPAAVKRAVRARDGGQCAFVDARGRRCRARNRLEFHHIQSYGRGGDHSSDNIQLTCRVHNLHQAELDYGKEAMRTYRRLPSQVSEPAAIYTFSNRTTLFSSAASFHVFEPGVSSDG